jgi:hypothetical protein
VSLRAAVIAALDSLLGDKVYDDEVPEGTPRPYAQVMPDVALVGDQRGDGAKAAAWRRSVQVSLFEDLGAESESLKLSVIAALDGHRPGGGTFRLIVESAPRLEDPDYHIVHTPITVGAVTLR